MNKFDDAFLCLDKNGNGLIDNGSELFGDQYGAQTGFDELAKYDSNKDGIVNESDEVYSKLLLWSDMNKDGRVNYYPPKEDSISPDKSKKECVDDISACVTDELKTLKEMSVDAIKTSYNVEYDADNVTVLEDEHSNTIGITGEFFVKIWDTMKNAFVVMARKIIDVFFIAR